MPHGDSQPCAGARYGEVIAVIHDGRSPDRITAATLTTTHPMGQAPSDDPTLRSCDAALNPYLGLPPGPDGDGVDAVDGWSYTGLVIPAPVGPDNRQRAAGQHWVACVLIGLDPDRQTGTASVYMPEICGVRSPGVCDGTTAERICPLCLENDPAPDLAAGRLFAAPCRRGFRRD